MRTFISNVLIMSTLLITPVSAEILAQNESLYTDEKTGLTIVFADVELIGHYQFDEPVLSAVSQLTILQSKFTGHYTYEDFKADPSLYLKAGRRYRFGGILRDTSIDEVILTIHSQDGHLKESLRLNLNAAKTNPATREDFHQWIQNRFQGWNQIAQPGTPNLMHDIWVKKSQSVYGTQIPDTSVSRIQRNHEAGLGALAIFGGQTAIRETLQTQFLTNSNQPADSDLLIDITTIAGVEVSAHPYTKMLEELTATTNTATISQATLADYVPEDRLMILIREPEKMAELVNRDHNLFARLMPMLGTGYTDYTLFERYAARFGLTPAQVKTWLFSKNIEEVALFVPDVFFLDNTDLTVVIRLKPSADTPFKIAKDMTGIVPVTLPQGETFYLAHRDHLLFVSSHKSELEQSLLLVDKKGTGSLGASAEFKVMRHKLPLTATSRVYLYFSDPFIRHLTSPAVKIGQYRRASARNTLETITAMALLYRLDHGTDADLATLKRHGYLTEEEVPETEYTLKSGLRAVSKTWGTLDRLTPLTANPLTQVTQAEANSYIAYRERYSRFWQQYFDPIAIRADLMEDGKVTLETFILPLIDNSIYNGIKEIVGIQSPDKTEIPHYSQTPIATLAFNLPKENLPKIINNFFPSSYSLSAFLPFLGNTLALSIHDSDPVVQTNFPGLETLSQQNNFLFGVRGRDLLIVPIIGALYTRPVDLAIQVTDEEQVRTALRHLPLKNNQYSQFRKTYHESENQFILNWTLFGVIRMEFSLKIDQGWLQISNHPWTPVAITGTQSLAPNHTVVLLRPSELKKALPQILSLAQSAYRHSVYISAARLLPWITAYQTDQNTAVMKQKNALGSGTPLPPAVSLSTNPLTLKPYGFWENQVIPAADKQDTTLIKLLPNLDLWLRFEAEGLRSRIEFIPD